MSDRNDEPFSDEELGLQAHDERSALLADLAPLLDQVQRALETLMPTAVIDALSALRAWRAKT